MILSGLTPLASLNDGNGVHRAKAGGDFTINGMTVDLSGILKDSTRLERLNHGQGVALGRIRITTVDDEGSRIPIELDLTGLKTVGEIKRKIEEAVPGLSVALTGSRLTVGYSDSSKTRFLKIEDLVGSAARNLGIDGSSDLGRISGREVLVVDRIDDVLAAINYAEGNDGTIRASLRTKRLEITAGGADVTLAAVEGSSALEHLGFEARTYQGAAAGRRILGAVDSVLLRTLNGGRGVQAGTILIESSAGGSATIDLSAAESLQQVVDLINEGAERSGLALVAEYDRTGTRLVVSSTDGSTLTISDETGNFAESTGLYRTDQSEIRSNNLQRQYVSHATLLSELNAGNGVRLGEIRVTDSRGISRTIRLAEGSPRSVGDIIARLNSEAKDGGLGIVARINDTGDGLLIEDTAGGGLALKVEDLSGAAARDLNLLRAAADGRIDGSYETRIEVSANETLSGLVTRINQAGALASASILSDGNPVNPYRLQITASRPGLAGELVIDEAGIGLDLAVLTRAQDAKLILGSDAQHGVLISSSSNTIANVVPGLTVTLNGVSDEPVTVTVNQEVKAAIEALEGLATAFNALMDRIKELAGYNKATEKAGILLGESTVRAVENRIFRLITGTVPGAPGGLQRLSEVGLTLEGGKLTFNAEKFQKALAEGADGVIEFFTQEKTGAAAWIKAQIEAITGSEGLIPRRTEALGKKTEVLNQRVAALNELLERKQQRLTRQFNLLEQALSELQSQQTALTQLAALAGGFNLSRSGGQR
jgi:flagellar hook-associated protein 2